MTSPREEVGDLSSAVRGVGVELDAGRELDALVAEGVMGIPAEHWAPPCVRYHSTDDAEWDWTRHESSGWCYSCSKPISEVPGEPPRYSTVIAEAWEVVEKLLAGRWMVTVVGDSSEAGVEGYEVNVWTAYPRIRSVDATADTAPLAICKAALAAIATRTPPDSSFKNPTEASDSRDEAVET